MPSEINQDILPLLRDLIDGSLPQRETENLVRHTVTRAEQLIYWLSRRKSYRMQAIGLSHRDLAYDMTAELFAEGDDTPCAPLRTALLPHADATDRVLLSALDAVLIRTVHRQFPRIFAEVNPEYYLLVKALRQHMAQRDDVETVDMLDGRWYLFGGTAGALLQLPTMPPDELRRRLGPMDPLHRSVVVEIFRLVGEVLRKQNDYRRAVLEIDVVRIALDFVGRKYGSEHPEAASDMPIPYDVAALSHAIHRAVESVRDSLERFYVERNRLSRTDFELMLRAVRASLLDGAEGDDAHSGYAQLRQFMPGLTPERYRETYRRKYAYMRELVIQEARLSLRPRKISTTLHRERRNTGS